MPKIFTLLIECIGLYTGLENYLSTVGCWLSHVAKGFNGACGHHVQPAIVELNPPPAGCAVGGG